MRNRLVGEYVRKLIGQAANVFSVISLLLALLVLFFPVNNLNKASLTGFFAVLSLLPAGFYVWKETVEKLPKLADLKIDYTSVTFGGGGWSGALPLLPLKFRVIFDLRNKGEEKAKLAELKVTTCHLGTDLLEAKKNAIKLHEQTPNILRQQIHLPYDIPGRDWRSIMCEMPVELHQQDPKEFAKLVKELKMFHIELQFEYEDMDGNRLSDSISIEESFEDFRKIVLQSWIERQQHELVYIMKDIS